MIADTTFLSDLLKERRRDRPGPATALLNANRCGVRTTIISVGEIAVLFPKPADAWEWLARWRILPLTPGIAQQSAGIERHMKKKGEQLGENDNWIAGFAAYYREPVISHDTSFDHVPGVRRFAYERV